MNEPNNSGGHHPNGRSMLIYRCLPNDPASIATLIGLHGRGADLDQLAPLCGEAAPSFELVTPQAPRPTNAVSPCGDPPQVRVALLSKPESLLGLVEGLVGSLG